MPKRELSQVGQRLYWVKRGFADRLDLVIAASLDAEEAIDLMVERGEINEEEARTELAGLNAAMKIFYERRG